MAKLSTKSDLTGSFVCLYVHFLRQLVPHSRSVSERSHIAVLSFHVNEKRDKMHAIK